MAQSERESSRIGEVLDRQFRLDALLGAGGMGEAYLAEQLGMERRAVVKLLHAHLVRADQPFRERFAREAKVVARLNHPNVVQIYACGETADGVPYLAMEHADGSTLKQELLEAGPFSEARVLHVGRQVCEALGEAHRLGIVHRDLKPENVMLVQRHAEPDVVKLLDFGIAKLAGSIEPSRLTRSGMVFGTPQYMAPEQIRGGGVDGRTDVYALGLVLYELLTGAPAMAGDSEFDVLTRQVTETPPPLRSLGVSVSPRLEQAILRCLEKSPELRWASAAELGSELSLVATELGPAARQAASSPRRPLASGPRPIAFSAPPISTTRPRVSAKGPREPVRGTPGGRLRAGSDTLEDDDDEECGHAAHTESDHDVHAAQQAAQYPNYYDKLPLPRALKPFAPWILSLVYAVVMMSMGTLLQWCNAHLTR